MKKIFLAASLFVAFAVSAQQTGERQHRQKPKAKEMVSKMDKELNLSNQQEKKLTALFQEKDQKMEKNRGDFNGQNGESTQGKDFSKNDKRGNEMDSKIQKILSKDQYTKFKANHEKRRSSFYENNGGKMQKKAIEKRG